MRILILNGSPRKNGKIAQILHLINNRTEQDDTVAYYDVCDLHFNSCVGCMACRKNSKCILKADDGHKIADEINNCDVLIVGTPVYWGNMNGDLKRLFDRLAGIMMGETQMGIPKPLQKGKKAYIVVSCTTPFPFNIFAGQSTKAISSLKEILSYSGFKIKEKIVLPGTKGMKELPKKIVNKANKIARKSKKI